MSIEFPNCQDSYCLNTSKYYLPDTGIYICEQHYDLKAPTSPSTPSTSPTPLISPTRITTLLNFLSLRLSTITSYLDPQSSPSHRTPHHTLLQTYTTKLKSLQNSLSHLTQNSKIDQLFPLYQEAKLCNENLKSEKIFLRYCIGRDDDRIMEKVKGREEEESIVIMKRRLEEEYGGVIEGMKEEMREKEKRWEEERRKERVKVEVMKKGYEGCLKSMEEKHREEMRRGDVRLEEAVEVVEEEKKIQMGKLKKNFLSTFRKIRGTLHMYQDEYDEKKRENERDSKRAERSLNNKEKALEKQKGYLKERINALEEENKKLQNRSLSIEKCIEESKLFCSSLSLSLNSIIQKVDHVAPLRDHLERLAECLIIPSPSLQEIAFLLHIWDEDLTVEQHEKELKKNGIEISHDYGVSSEVLPKLSKFKLPNLSKVRIEGFKDGNEHFKDFLKDSFPDKVEEFFFDRYEYGVGEGFLEEVISVCPRVIREIEICCFRITRPNFKKLFSSSKHAETLKLYKCKLPLTPPALSEILPDFKLKSLQFNYTYTVKEGDWSEDPKYFETIREALFEPEFFEFTSNLLKRTLSIQEREYVVKAKEGGRYEGMQEVVLVNSLREEGHD